MLQVVGMAILEIRGSGLEEGLGLQASEAVYEMTQCRFCPPELVQTLIVRM
jgi:hypothetical protein